MAPPTKKNSHRRRPSNSRRPSRDNLVGAFDQSIRFLLHKRPDAFLSFGLGNRPVRVLAPIPGALPALGRDMDGGYRVLLEEIGQERVAHIELHRRHQSRHDLGNDVLEAQARIFKREGIAVLSLVFDLYGDEHAPVLSDEEMIFGVGLGSVGASRCTYRRVNLKGLAWQELLAMPAPALWSLVPLSRGGTALTALLSARDAIESRVDLSPVDRADQLAVLCFLAEAVDVAAAVFREYIKEERLMQSTLYESIISKGVEKGISKGRAENMAQTVLKVLRKRLGTVDEAVTARVQGEQDAEVLERWYEEALEAIDADSARRLVQRILAP